MRFISSISIILSACLFQACATKIEIPGAKAIKAEEACGALSGRKCAPSMGIPIPFTQQYKTVPADRNGEQIALDYLGTVVRSTDVRGEPGAICGYGETSLFDINDIEAATYGNKIDLEIKQKQTAKTDVEFDVKSALLAADVSSAVTDSIVAEVGTIIERDYSSTTATSATLREYQLKHEVLKSLEYAMNGKGGSRFSNCAVELLGDTPQWKLYQAITTLEIETSSLDSTEIGNLSATIVASVDNMIAKKSASGEISGADPAKIAKLDAELTRKVTTTLRTASQPYNVVIGASFWKSPRYHSITTTN